MFGSLDCNWISWSPTRENKSCYISIGKTRSSENSSVAKKHTSRNGDEAWLYACLPIDFEKEVSFEWCIGRGQILQKTTIHGEVFRLRSKETTDYRNFVLLMMSTSASKRRTNLDCHWYARHVYRWGLSYESLMKFLSAWGISKGLHQSEWMIITHALVCSVC